jgi:hypothetical protein
MSGLRTLWDTVTNDADGRAAAAGERAMAAKGKQKKKKVSPAEKTDGPAYAGYAINQTVKAIKDRNKRMSEY